MVKYSQEQLVAKTIAEVRAIAKALGVKPLSGSRDDIAARIIAYQDEQAEEPTTKEMMGMMMKMMKQMEDNKSAPKFDKVGGADLSAPLWDGAEDRYEAWVEELKSWKSLELSRERLSSSTCSSPIPSFVA